MAIRAAGVGYRNLAAQNVQVSASPAPVLGPTLAATTGPAPVLIPVSSLTSIQMRAAMDQPTVDEYAEVMLAANGWGPFPPAEAFSMGQSIGCGAAIIVGQHCCKRQNRWVPALTCWRLS